MNSTDTSRYKSLQITWWEIWRSSRIPNKLRNYSGVVTFGGSVNTTQVRHEKIELISNRVSTFKLRDIHWNKCVFTLSCFQRFTFRNTLASNLL